MGLRYLNGDDVRDCLPMIDAIAAVRRAFTDEREVPPRVALRGSLFMPGRVGGHTGVKVVSTVPGNPAGLVAVFGPDGDPIGVVDGPTLTALRTGAATGLATQIVAPADAKVLAMLGAGAMAPDQVAAVCTVRPIERVVVWSRSRERAQTLAGSLDARVATDVVDRPEDAVAEADVVVTATPATEPLFDPASVRPGTHLNAIGAFTPAMAELPRALLRDAWIVVDDRAAASTEAGDLLQARCSAHADLSDLLAGRARPPVGSTTVFKSVGVASMDVATAVAALQEAARR